MSEEDRELINAASLLYWNCKAHPDNCTGCPLVRMEPKIDTLCRCRIGDGDMFPENWRMGGVDG